MCKSVVHIVNSILKSWRKGFVIHTLYISIYLYIYSECTTCIGLCHICWASFQSCVWKGYFSNESMSQKINGWYKNLDEIMVLNLTLINFIVSVAFLKYENALQTFNQLPLMALDVIVQMAALIGICTSPILVNKFMSDSNLCSLPSSSDRRWVNITDKRYLRFSSNKKKVVQQRKHQFWRPRLGW
jgi:hypothetical protein